MREQEGALQTKEGELGALEMQLATEKHIKSTAERRLRDLEIVHEEFQEKYHAAMSQQNESDARRALCGLLAGALHLDEVVVGHGRLWWAAVFGLAVAECVRCLASAWPRFSLFVLGRCCACNTLGYSPPLVSSAGGNWSLCEPSIHPCNAPSTT